MHYTLHKKICIRKKKKFCWDQSDIEKRLLVTFCILTAKYIEYLYTNSIQGTLYITLLEKGRYSWYRDHWADIYSKWATPFLNCATPFQNWAMRILKWPRPFLNWATPFLNSAMLILKWARPSLKRTTTFLNSAMLILKWATPCLKWARNCLNETCYPQYESRHLLNEPSHHPMSPATS